MTSVRKKRVYAILEIASEDDILSKYFDIFIISLITLNGIAMILETVEMLGQNFHYFFWLIEAISVPIFTIEYLVRLWACTATPEYSHSIFGRLKYFFKPLSLVDLLAILPFYLAFMTVDLRTIRVLRIFRIIRLARLTRYSSAMWTFHRVFLKKKDELTVGLSTTAMLLVLTSTLIYYAENTAQPDKFSSIPASMYWGIVTLTTLGYGDVVPITSMGKLLGALTGLLGIAIFAIPAGILASGFADEVRNRNEPRLQCPKCGEKLERRVNRPKDLV